MLSHTSRLSLLALLLLTVVAFGPAPAQRLKDGEVAFTNKARRTRALRNDLVKGATQADPTNKEHLEAAELEAKESIYPLAWVTQAGRPRDGDIDRIVIRQFDSALSQMTKSRANTQVMQHLFTRYAIGAILEVIQEGRPIAAVNAARTTLARDAAALGAAAAAIDAVDEVAVTGDRDAVRAARRKAAAPVEKAAATARRLNKDVTAYDRAIARLDEAAATPSLRPEERGAIERVVTAGRQEARQLHTYATVIATVWPRYERLDETQGLWLARSSNGWYRDQQEGAGAYVVLADRTTMATARRALAAADAKRLTAAKKTDAAVADARAALAALRD